MTRSPAEGVSLRHSRRCSSRLGGDCDCKPSYQAQVWAPQQGKPIRRTFRTLREARTWRGQAKVDLRRGRLGAPTKTTIDGAAEEWLAGARSGVVRTRSGEPYKPSAVRSYEFSLQRFVLPELGKLRLSALTKARLQQLIDGLLRRDYSPSTVRNAVLPLRAIYRRAAERGEVVANPTTELALPADRSRRDRVSPPKEAEALLRALPPADRALWATAMYAGLRRGELQALRWESIDLEEGILRVERSWDRVAGEIEPKSRSGRRRVPIPGSLRTHLVEQRLRQGAGGVGFALSRTGARPFDPSGTRKRAILAFARAGLEPVTLHDCRHTYAALMIAAGVNVKALSSYMGHSSITVTLDRYGHLMPGAEREAAALLDGFLEREKAASVPAPGGIAALPERRGASSGS